MFKKNPDKAVQAWKEKYFSTLEELEKKEKEWTTLDDAMRNAMSRLSVLLDGIDPSLDKELTDLRKAIRKRASGQTIRNQIRAILERLEEVEQDKSRKKSLTPVDTLDRLCNMMPLPKGTARKLKGLRKNIDRLGKDDDIEPVLQELVDLLRYSYGLIRDQAIDKTRQELEAGRATAEPATSETVAASADLAPVQEQGVDPSGRMVLETLLDRLQMPDDLVQEIGMVRSRLQSTDLQEELQRLAQELAAILNDALPITDGAQQVDAALDEAHGLTINEVLLQLLERLELPADVGEDVNEIQTRLAGEISDDEWPELLEAISCLIRAMREHAQQEKRSLEAFLSQLTDQLQTLDDFISGVEQDHHDSISNGQQVSEQVHEQIRNIGASVEQASELDQLKYMVRDRLDQIAAHLDDFRRHETDRDERAQERIRELNEQIRVMERDSEQLRNRVAQEREQALMDPLTGVHNRMAYDERLEQEYQRWKRYRGALTLMVIDIDHFKRINDTYGHMAGDKVLAKVAHLLQDKIRETDFLARYGGEEFVIIMPDTGVEEGLTVAEKLRSEVEQCGFHYREQAVQITISCGVAAFQGHDTEQAVFERADQAMYGAKQAGRNRCQAA